jgi:hypothetical protein
LIRSSWLTSENADGRPVSETEAVEKANSGCIPAKSGPDTSQYHADVIVPGAWIA